MQLRERYLWYIAHPDKLVEDLQAAVEVNHQAMSKELREQSALFLTWAHMASMARYELRKAERTLKDQIIPDLRDAARVKIRAAKEKETNDTVDDAMKLSPVYQQQARIVDDLQFVSDLLEDAADALWERKGCLQSANARDGRELGQYD